MYTLADERVMYVPPLVRTKLADLGIQPREPFTICKAERKDGNRRFIEWQVNKDNGCDERPPSETPPVNGQTNGAAYSEIREWACRRVAPVARARGEY
jgi:hypothetical protein